ncbi:MAG: hypothetical protein PVG99_02535 [Desulfobacteraceae bacterium]|jgi:DNA-binding NtrC family response regulator
MDEPIAIVNTNESEGKELCAKLEECHFRAVCLDSLMSLEKHLQANPCRILLLDFDSVPVSNRNIRELKRVYPGICIMGLSLSRFHPDLQESIGTHVYAMLTKPVDEDELIFLLKSIHEEDANSKDS